MHRPFGYVIISIGDHSHRIASFAFPSGYAVTNERTNITTSAVNEMVYRTTFRRSTGTTQLALHVYFIATLAIMSTVVLSMSLCRMFGVQLSTSCVSIHAVMDSLFGSAPSLDQPCEVCTVSIHHVLRRLSLYEGHVTGTPNAVQKLMFSLGFCAAFSVLCASLMAPYMVPAGYTRNEQGTAFQFWLRSEEADEEERHCEGRRRRRRYRRAHGPDRERRFALTRAIDV